LFLLRSSTRFQALILLSYKDKSSQRKLALTNFFDLSNIRVESWGAGEMFGASRCFLKMPFQLDGQPALEADWPFGCDSSIHRSTNFKNFSRYQGERRMLACFRAGLRSFYSLNTDHGLEEHGGASGCRARISSVTY